MKIEDIELGIMNYINQEIAPKATGLMKFGIYTGAFLFANKGEKLLNSHLATLQKMDLIDNEMNIDIDSLYKASKMGMAQSGNKLEIKGMIFNESDLDKIYEYIKNGKG